MAKYAGGLILTAIGLGLALIAGMAQYGQELQRQRWQEAERQAELARLYAASQLVPHVAAGNDPPAAVALLEAAAPQWRQLAIEAEVLARRGGQTQPQAQQLTRFFAAREALALTTAAALRHPEDQLLQTRADQAAVQLQSQMEKMQAALDELSATSR